MKVILGNVDNKTIFICKGDKLHPIHFLGELAEFEKLPKYFKLQDGVYVADDEAIKKEQKEKYEVSALNELNNEYELKVLALANNIPNSEKLTWTKQEMEAREYKKDNTYPTPLLDAIVSARKIDKEIFINKVIEKADAYSQAIGYLTGERQAKEELLNE
jgi:hypothetical protein